MTCSTPGFPVLHCLPELVQTHVHQVGDATQPSHPLLSPFPPAFSLSQHHQWPQPAASAAVDRAHSQQPSPLLKWSAIRFKNGKYNFLTGKTGLMSVLTLKHPGGEVGDESWSQASGPREQWLSPGKRSRGFWPMVLVNWMCPSVYVPTSRMRCPHLPTWGGCKTSVCRGRGVWRPGGNTWNCLIRVPPGRTDRKASLELFLN